MKFDYKRPLIYKTKSSHTFHLKVTNAKNLIPLSYKHGIIVKSNNCNGAKVPQ